MIRKAAATSAVALGMFAATGAAAQTCTVLNRLDNFGTVRFGSHFETMPQGLEVVEHCLDGVATGQCVLRDPDGVTYTLYEGYVISKFVFVGQGALPWEFEEDADRARSANLLTRLTELRASGVLADDNQLHVRSQFACGDAWGQAFARYSGNRLIAVGIEAANL